MNPYIPNTNTEKDEMLKLIGSKSVSDLFSDVPENLKLNRRLSLDKPRSELEVSRAVSNCALKNNSADELICFLGAGAYDHYIPSVVNHLVSRSEFYTAYTPYQPEISQGTLQAIFEYQSMITALTGMDISNASMYDGASALAESAMMAIESTKRKKVVVSSSVNPDARQVLKTYLRFHNVEVVEIDASTGFTDTDALKANVDSATACVIIQNPNFFGVIEEMEEIEKITHANKSMLLMSVNPISLGILTPPSEYGADIVTGDGQALGNEMNFGGPSLGFIAVNKALMRKMPGRICGATTDIDGKRAFVLTLQAREQHIRREKATSNICSNQALNALCATIYLATLGKSGIREVAEQCAHKAHYTMRELTASGKFKLLFNRPFFMEFALDLGNSKVSITNQTLKNNGILGGLDLCAYYPQFKNATLLCVTEKRSIEEIQKLKRSMEGLL